MSNLPKTIDRSLYENGIRFECQGSGKCCKSRGGHNYVYVNLEERRRLAKHFGISTAAFTRKYCARTKGWYHIKEPEADCIFLDGARCSVYEARPDQCRSWPFWPEKLNRKDWQNDVVSFCPGIGKGKLHSAEEIEAVLREELKREDGE